MGAGYTLAPVDLYEYQGKQLFARFGIPVSDGAVAVNGEVETQRGRQLRDGDVIAVGGEALRIAAGPP